MHQLWHWLFTLDGPTRAALIGATATCASVLIALLGVLLTINDNRRRARAEQLITFRREAYLDLCDVAATALHHLGSLHLPNVTLATGASFLARLSGALAKVHILGNAKTIRMTQSFATKFFDEYAKVAAVKATFEDNETQIKGFEQWIAQLSREPDKLDNRSFRRACEKNIEVHAQRNAELENSLAKQASEAVSETATQWIELCLAIREELNLGDADLWRRALSETSGAQTRDRSEMFLSEKRTNEAAIEKLICSGD